MAESTILDIDGKPFKLSDLKEPQTEADSKLAQLHRHFAEHPSSGLSPSKLAGILREAEEGNLIAQCELAEDMEEKDAHIQSELGKRRMIMQGVDWNIVPPPDASAAEIRDAEMIESLLRSATWLDEAIFDMGDAILKSFSNLEIKWDFAEGEHYIAKTHWRDSSWFQTHPDNRNELRIRDQSQEGEALRPFGWISHVAKSKSGYLARNGLCRVLAWPFLFKNYSVRDLAEFLEIYGLPMRLGKYPSGASDREKLTLLRAVMSIGHNAGGIIPKGMDIEFENAAVGQSDPFMAMINWTERSQSKAILGGTLTSQADGKSSTNALGNVHNEVRQDIRDSDLKAVAATLTRDVVYPMYALNGKSFSSPRRIPRFEFDLNEGEDLTEFVTPLKELTELNVPIPVSWVYEKTKIPMPGKGDAVLTINTPPPQNTALAALSAQNHKADEMDSLVENLQQGAGQATTDMLAQLQQLVEKADTLEQLQEQIMSLNLDSSELENVLSQALTVAAVAGRYELLQDAQ